MGLNFCATHICVKNLPAVKIHINGVCGHMLAFKRTVGHRREKLQWIRMVRKDANVVKGEWEM